jgi:hypothetical protein
MISLKECDAPFALYQVIGLAGVLSSLCRTRHCYIYFYYIYFKVVLGRSRACCLENQKQMQKNLQPLPQTPTPDSKSATQGEQPSIPQEPSTPAIPPTQPETPRELTVPETPPAQPETPQHPSIPETPEKPSAPEIPQRTSIPETYS